MQWNIDHLYSSSMQRTSTLTHRRSKLKTKLANANMSVLRCSNIQLQCLETCAVRQLLVYVDTVWISCTDGFVSNHPTAQKGSHTLQKLSLEYRYINLEYKWGWKTSFNKNWKTILLNNGQPNTAQHKCTLQISSVLTKKKCCIVVNSLFVNQRTCTQVHSNLFFFKFKL